MGFKTPNIDRIAKEGVMFTDYYGEQSCLDARPGHDGYPRASDLLADRPLTASANHQTFKISCGDSQLLRIVLGRPNNK
jgi:hypothetical protein